MRIKIQQMNIDIFWNESNFVGVNRLYVLIHLNRNRDIKRFNAHRYYLPKGIIKTIMWSSMEKTFMINQLIPIQNYMKKLEN